MQKREIEELFTKMGLESLNHKIGYLDHWRIPNEDCVVRILNNITKSGFDGFWIEIKFNIRSLPATYSPEQGIKKIQDLIQIQFEDTFHTLFGFPNLPFINDNMWYHQSEVTAMKNAKEQFNKLFNL